MLKRIAITCHVIVISLLFVDSIRRFSGKMMAYNETTGNRFRSDDQIELPPRTVKSFVLQSIIGNWYEIYHSTNLDEVWGGSVATRTCIQATIKPLTARIPSRTHFINFQLHQNKVNIWNGTLTRRIWETAEGKLILQEKGIESRERFHVYIVAFDTSHPGYLALSDPLGIHLQVFSRSKQFSISQQSRVLCRELEILGFTREWNKPRLTLHDNCTHKQQ